MRRSLLVLILLVLFINLAAEDLETTLEQLSEIAAKAYVAPIVSGFGTDLNGGWFHKSPKASFLGLNFELGLVVMATPFKDEDESFNTNGDFYFNREQAEIIAEDVDPAIQEYVIDAIMDQEFTVEMNGPTVIGDSDESIMIILPSQPITVETPAGTQSVDLPETMLDLGIGGLISDLEFLPLAAPQLTVGTIYGTQLSMRYMPAYDVEDIGEVNYMGFGIQHNPKAWFPMPLPVDFCLAFFSQSLDVGDIMTTSAFSYGLNVSKTFGVRMLSWTPYAGFMAEGATMEFKYDYVLDNDLIGGDVRQIKFEVESENKSRFTIGSSFRAGVVNFNVDYNIGEYSSVTAGIGIAF